MSRAASGINVTALRVLRLARLLRILSGWALHGTGDVLQVKSGSLRV